MNDQELWAFFLERTGTETAAYEAWSFGDSPRVADELLALVLAHWRQVHQDFFTRELSPYNVLFFEDMLVVCEEFELVFVPPALVPGQKAR